MPEPFVNKRKEGQRRRSDARRLIIIQSATNLFIQYGFEAVTVDDVAAEANASKQTIYRHFGSREGLVSAVISSVLATMLTPLERSLRSEDGRRAQLHEIAKAYQKMAFDSQGLRLVRFLIGVTPGSPKLGDCFAEQVIHRVISLIEPVVAEALGKDKAVVETEAFLAILQGKEYNRALVGQTPDWRRLNALRTYAVSNVLGENEA